MLLEISIRLAIDHIHRVGQSKGCYHTLFEVGYPELCRTSGCVAVDAMESLTPHTVSTCRVDDEHSKCTRSSGLMFNAADVFKPLASAAKVCEAGEQIILDPELVRAS